MVYDCTRSVVNAVVENIDKLPTYDCYNIMHHHFIK